MTVVHNLELAEDLFADGGLCIYEDDLDDGFTNSTYGSGGRYTHLLGHGGVCRHMLDLLHAASVPLSELLQLL